jgi:hypothetical protein
MEDIPAYVEISFKMPFYDLYYEGEWDEQIPKQPHELLALCNWLQIELNTDLLYETYSPAKIGQGDIYILKSPLSEGSFLYFDLLKDPYDQMAMVSIGLRVPTLDLDKIRLILRPLYFKSKPRSPLEEDYFNQKLWRTATGHYPVASIQQVRHGLQ